MRGYSITMVKDRFAERRKYVRLEVPVGISYAVPEIGTIHNASTKNISADGLRFEASDKSLQVSSAIELKLNIPGAVNPVHAKGNVIWKRKISSEDRTPFDFGVEIIEIEEDNKNTFLKFLCDLIYTIEKEPGYEKKKL